MGKVAGVDSFARDAECGGREERLKKGGVFVFRDSGINFAGGMGREGIELEETRGE